MTFFIQQLHAHWGWLLLASVLMFMISLLLIPYTVARIPADYFVQKRKLNGNWVQLPKPLQWILFGIRQLLGVMCILAGIIMLVVPGQGVLTILVGLMLIRFPGKYLVVRWLVRRPGVLRALNWIRARAEEPPLEI